jgi:hypothetical protein
MDTCRNGHERTRENTYINNGQKRCKICQSASQMRTQLKIARGEHSPLPRITKGEIMLVSDLLMKSGARFFAAQVQEHSERRNKELEIAVGYLKEALETLKYL